MTNDNTDFDDRTLMERINEEMVIDRPQEIARLAREAEKLAQFCYTDAPATSGYLEGVASDLREARRMFTDESEERDDE